jgi:hypothetical protein
LFSAQEGARHPTPPQAGARAARGAGTACPQNTAPRCARTRLLRSRGFGGKPPRPGRPLRAACGSAPLRPVGLRGPTCAAPDSPTPSASGCPACLCRAGSAPTDHRGRGRPLTTAQGDLPAWKAGTPSGLCRAVWSSAPPRQAGSGHPAPRHPVRRPGATPSRLDGRPNPPACAE